MTLKSSEEAIELRVGDDTVTLKKPGQSAVVIAKILGRRRNDVDGRDEVIWLDRLVHKDHGPPISGWIATGAISTVLTRQAAS